ncbi:MAG: PAS domain-containing protein [Pedobacter sp.]|nr:MAG: PAS domain-containing protein [Pedobacter sp.]
MVNPSNLLDNEQLISVLNASKTPTSIHVGENAVIQFANDAMLSVWGKDRSIVGLPVEEALPELIGQPFGELFASAWREGITHLGKEAPANLVVNGELRTYYFDFEYRAIKDSKGDVCCVMNSAVDVTERVQHKKTLLDAIKNAEALKQEQATNEKLNADKIALKSQIELRSLEALENAEQFRRLVEQAPIAITVLQGEDLIIDIVNQTMLEIWGKDISIVGLPLAKAMPELEGQPFIGILKNVIHSGEPFYAQESRAFVVRNGILTEGYFNFICQPLKDGLGNINSVLQVVTEVTEQVEARLVLQRTQEMMDMAIDASNLGSWHIDPITKGLKYNPALARMYGYQGNSPMTFDQAIGQVTEDYRETLIREIDLAISTGGIYDITFTQKKFDDDTLIWLRSFGKVNLDVDGTALFSGFVMDVTQAKKDEQRKNDFIGMVSHELKTPLTSINGYIQLLQRMAKKDSNKPAEDITGSAIRQLQRMNGMINGFLNLSRLESGKIVLDKSLFLLNELITEIINESILVDSSHDVKLLKCGELSLYADRLKIGSVLSNLLNNAVKYSPHAKLVTVDCSLVGNNVQVCIKDEGIGISKEHIDHLFDRYYRVESKSQISGFGIGLYLSAEVIYRHQGKIWAESELGKGSTFCFTLPIVNEVN